MLNMFSFYVIIIYLFLYYCPTNSVVEPSHKHTHHHRHSKSNHTNSPHLAHVKSVHVGDPFVLVDVVISAKTNLSVIRPCVESLVRFKPVMLNNTKRLRQRVIFADDGSPPETIAYERSMCRKFPSDFVCLSTNKTHNGLFSGTQN